MSPAAQAVVATCCVVILLAFTVGAMWIQKARQRAFDRLFQFLDKHKAVQGLRRTGPQSAVFETARGPGELRMAARTTGTVGGERVLEIDVALGRQWSPVRLTREGLGTDKLLGAQDVQVGDRAFDSTWRIATSDPRAARMALTPDVRALVQKMGLRGLRLRGHTLTVVRSDGSGTVPFLLATLRLAEELSEGGWDPAARRLGLEVRETGTLSGAIRGVPVEVRLEGAHTVVWAQALDHGVRAIHKDHGSGGVAIGDPVLDGLVALRGSRAVMRQALSDPETVGALLAVVHGHPGSEVLDDGVHLRHPGMVIDGLDELVLAAVDLAERLRVRDPSPPEG